MDKKETTAISIVTRAYNVEPYIRECADSVLGQSFTDFEWIVLDNGSTDGTGDILKEYADKDRRIRLFINRENYNKIEPCQGYYSYVDLLKETRGRYLTDLDSDDLLKENYLTALYETAIEYHAEIVAAGAIYFKVDNIHHTKQIMRLVYSKSFTDNDITQMGKNIQDFLCAFGTTWGKLVIRNLYLDNLKYIFQRPPYLSYGGDTYTMFRLLQLAQNCVCIEEPLYLYRVRTDSTSQVDYYEDRPKAFDAVFHAQYQLLKKWGQLSFENIFQLCISHSECLYNARIIICQHQNMPMAKRAELIQKTFENDLYRDYFCEFAHEIKQEWDNKNFELFYQFWEQYQTDEIALFYGYHFGRRFMARRLIAKKEMDRYDVMGYIVSSVTLQNPNRYDDELLNTCVHYISGKPCHSLAEAECFVEKCRTTDENEYKKKQKLAECLEQKNYNKLWNILNEFSSDMEWDRDVLYAKASYYSDCGQADIAIKILAVARDLYPEEFLIKQSLENLAFTNIR